MKVYIDSEFKCHTKNDGSMIEVELDFFNNKCDAFIEGYRFIPEGKSLIGKDGTVFYGETIGPWKNYEELDSIQRSYEQQLLNDYKEVIQILGVDI
jgi:hypothetical protein